jgi:membrane protein involved in colicin uptake
MVRVEDLMAAIQNGQSADDLAAEYAKALNEANARVKADAEAKAKAEAEARAASVKVADAKAVVVPLVKYLQTYIPEMDLGEVTDADMDEAAEFLVSAIDEVKVQLAPQLKLLKMLGGLDLDGETPKAKFNITRKPQTIGGKKDPIADFLKDMGL